jgi:hypothetical protein
VDSVRTEPLELTGSEAPVERLLALDTAGLGPVRLHPARVSARVEVEAVGERTLSGIPVRLASAAGAALRPSPDTVTVRVRGRETRLASLTQESVVVVADWQGPARPARVGLRVLAPAGITAQAEPDSVNLQMRNDDG